MDVSDSISSEGAHISTKGGILCEFEKGIRGRRRVLLLHEKNIFRRRRPLQ